MNFSETPCTSQMISNVLKHFVYRSSSKSCFLMAILQITFKKSYASRQPMPCFPSNKEISQTVKDSSIWKQLTSQLVKSVSQSVKNDVLCKQLIKSEHAERE